MGHVSSLRQLLVHSSSGVPQRDSAQSNTIKNMELTPISGLNVGIASSEPTPSSTVSHSGTPTLFSAPALKCLASASPNLPTLLPKIGTPSSLLRFSCTLQLDSSVSGTPSPTSGNTRHTFACSCRRILTYSASHSSPETPHHHMCHRHAATPPHPPPPHFTVPLALARANKCNTTLMPFAGKMALVCSLQMFAKRYAQRDVWDTQLTIFTACLSNFAETRPRVSHRHPSPSH